MPDYTPNQIVDILLILGECQKNYRAAARLYAERFPQGQHPDNTVIRAIERRCRQGKFKRTRRSRNQQDLENNPRQIAVVAMVHMNVHVSLREIENTLGVPRSTAHRYLRNVNFHPYHISLNQALTVQDHQRRINFCNWAQQRLLNDPTFFNFVMFSDEATFQSDGIINRHNSHYWSAVNPHWMEEIDHQHRWSVTVWCGILNGNLVGPYFFPGTVDGQIYLHLIRNELPILLENVDINTIERMWLQQDGAPAHYHGDVRNFLNEQFENQWIGRNGPVEWPARSPDLTSPDFYLWGYIKNLVYNNRPDNRAEMEQRIRDACQNIPREVLLNTVNSFRKRIQLCLQQNGGTFEHLLR